jgi:hypothetical protein
MQSRSTSDHPSYAQLLELVQTQQEQIALLQQENALLREKIESLQQSQHRQAAPFSRNQPINNPKPPGRKAGEGPFTYRKPPPAEWVDTEWVAAPLPSSVCPRCGGKLEAVASEQASTLDLPMNLRLVARCYEVSIGRCQVCGQRVRGRHPELPKDQLGATAHRIGARLRALCHYLHYALGLPQRKLPRLVEELFGVRLTQSAVCQDAKKQSQRQVGACYQRLREQVKQAAAVFTDDTGWRQAGKPAWLMVFETDQACVYQIRRQHTHQQVLELIPASYAGVLTSDRAKSYDAHAFSRLRKQKCLSHLMRSCSLVLETKKGKSRWFASTLKALFSQALCLWHEQTALSMAEYEQRRERLSERFTYHLRDRPLRDADNQRLLNGIGAQQDQGHLLRFLFDPQVLEPTNNRAERALRPAVIARKVSHCSKNQAGAQALCAFLSVLQTSKKQGHTKLIATLSALLSPSASACQTA